MSDFIEVSRTDEISDGAMKKVRAEGKDLLLARVGDRYYSADSRCPHLGGDLSRGTLEGTVVTCPRHHARFDLTDGRVIRWTDWSGMVLKLAKLVKPPRALRTYEVRIEGDRILVRR
ncbi:MAG: Rieske 2Fe-2S domain-containing protein [Methanosarcinales archaeon]|nr:Rieske 2Fe-2S domain-containing protein [Methanosarcinales archaeon]